MTDNEKLEELFKTYPSQMRMDAGCGQAKRSIAKKIMDMYA